MFEVEKSSRKQIVVRDYDEGHLWVFAIEDQGARTLATGAVIANVAARRAPRESARRAQSYAELEAWKRGLID